MAAANTTPFLLVNSDSNPAAVEVDGLVLHRGGEYVDLTADQERRVRETGAEIRKHTPSK